MAFCAPPRTTVTALDGAGDIDGLSEDDAAPSTIGCVGGMIRNVRPLEALRRRGSYRRWLTACCHSASVTQPCAPAAIADEARESPEHERATQQLFRPNHEPAFLNSSTARTQRMDDLVSSAKGPAPHTPRAAARAAATSAATAALNPLRSLCCFGGALRGVSPFPQMMLYDDETLGSRAMSPGALAALADEVGSDNLRLALRPGLWDEPSLPAQTAAIVSGEAGVASVDAEVEAGAASAERATESLPMGVEAIRGDSKTIASPLPRVIQMPPSKRTPSAQMSPFSLHCSPGVASDAGDSVAFHSVPALPVFLAGDAGAAQTSPLASESQCQACESSTEAIVLPGNMLSPRLAEQVLRSPPYPSDVPATARPLAGKAPPPPPPSSKAKAPGKAPPGKSASVASAKAGLPKWQGPSPSADLKAERIVNWQPIRQVSRWEGSVWQEIHTKMQQDSIPLPDSLLNRAFMRKADDPVHRQRRAHSSQRMPSARRWLPQQVGFTVDLLHAQLVQKGITIPKHLYWVTGRLSRDVLSDEADEIAELSEDVLEILLRLLKAVSGSEDKLLHSEQSDESLVPSEAFIKQLVVETGPIPSLLPCVEMALQMRCFFSQAALIDQQMRAGIQAADAVRRCPALPYLLEGALTLGNYVNASSKGLGQAVGVTLESLVKLAHTKCLPDSRQQVQPQHANKAKRHDNALHLLVRHLAQSRPSFLETLVECLDGCRAVRDMDTKALAEAVQTLAVQVRRVQEQRLTDDRASPLALDQERLQRFCSEAEPQTRALEALHGELLASAAALRKWVADPVDSSFGDMMRSLAQLRDALPSSSLPCLPPFPKVDRLCHVRHNRNLRRRASSASPMRQKAMSPPPLFRRASTQPPTLDSGSSSCILQRDHRFSFPVARVSRDLPEASRSKARVPKASRVSRSPAGSRARDRASAVARPFPVRGLPDRVRALSPGRKIAFRDTEMPSVLAPEDLPRPQIARLHLPLGSSAQQPGNEGLVAQSVSSVEVSERFAEDVVELPSSTDFSSLFVPTATSTLSPPAFRVSAPLISASSPSHDEVIDQPPTVVGVASAPPSSQQFVLCSTPAPSQPAEGQFTSMLSSGASRASLATPEKVAPPAPRVGELPFPTVRAPVHTVTSMQLQTDLHIKPREATPQKIGEQPVKTPVFKMEIALSGGMLC
eukprot:TRINITY_DN11009_c0_g2_i1.p1 TRINITY_DN11009_c0_g2~~TRINITY_DN11009_c0_g2_i1.p1  ORF type:complete len:1177 (-),score=170.05 TRINITY_DN11009_c0_g2_i1:293-3823(-)